MSNVIKINGYDVRDPNAVHYNAADGATDAQKAQARENIGGASSAEVADLKSTLNDNVGLFIANDYDLSSNLIDMTYDKALWKQGAPYENQIYTIYYDKAFPASQNDVIHAAIKNPGITGLRLMVYAYDSSMNYLSKTYIAYYGSYGSYTVPSGVSYVYFGISTNSTSVPITPNQIILLGNIAYVGDESYTADNFPEKYISVCRKNERDVAFLDAEKADKGWFTGGTLGSGSLVNDGKYVKASGVETSLAGTKCTDYINVVGNNSVEVCTQLGSNGCAIAFYDKNKTFLSDLKITGTNVGQFLVYSADLTEDAYSDVAFIRASCYSGGSFDSFYITLHSYYNDLVDTKIKNAIDNINTLTGKTINALGDSITSTKYTRPTWWEMISAKTGATFNNYGISGTSIAKLSSTASHGESFVERYDEMTDNADIVMVMGGTNDGHAQIGTWDSTDITTFYGALNVLITGLLNKYPGKPIVFFTMMRASTDTTMVLNPWESLQNKSATATLTLQLRAEAIKHKCLEYGIPCVDLYNGSGINGLDTNQVYYRSNDNLHPSAIGQNRLASFIQAELQKVAAYI